MMKDEG